VVSVARRLRVESLFLSTMVGVTKVLIVTVLVGVLWSVIDKVIFWITFFRNKRILKAQFPYPPTSSFWRGHATPDILTSKKGFENISNLLRKHGKTIHLRIFHRLVSLDRVQQWTSAPMQDELGPGFRQHVLVSIYESQRLCLSVATTLSPMILG
jgi:hypothetical protein